MSGVALLRALRAQRSRFVHLGLETQSEQSFGNMFDSLRIESSRYAIAEKNDAKHT